MVTKIISRKMKKKSRKNISANRANKTNRSNKLTGGGRGFLSRFNPFAPKQKAPINPPTTVEMFQNPIAHLQAGTRLSLKEMEAIRIGALSRMIPHPTVINPQEKGLILKTGKSKAISSKSKRIRWSNGKNNGSIDNGSTRVREYDPENSPSQVALDKNMQ